MIEVTASCVFWNTSSALEDTELIAITRSILGTTGGTKHGRKRDKHVFLIKPLKSQYKDLKKLRACTKVLHKSRGMNRYIKNDLA